MRALQILLPEVSPKYRVPSDFDVRDVVQVTVHLSDGGMAMWNSDTMEIALVDIKLALSVKTVDVI